MYTWLAKYPAPVIYKAFSLLDPGKVAYYN